MNPQTLDLKKLTRKLNLITFFNLTFGFLAILSLIGVFIAKDYGTWAIFCFVCTVLYIVTLFEGDKVEAKILVYLNDESNIDIDEIHEAYDLFDEISDMDHPNPLVRERANLIAETIEELLDYLEPESEHETN